jgi:hypothetical protein
MKKLINEEFKRMQQLAGILKENINLPGVPLDSPANGILWRLATPEDDVSSKYVWIENNVRSILTRLYRSLGEEDNEEIYDVISSITYELSPLDYDIEGTVREFLQGFKEEYENFGL